MLTTIPFQLNRKFKMKTQFQLVFLIIIASSRCEKRFQGSILEYLKTNHYNTFLKMVQEAGVEDLLNGTSPVTLFGPANRYYYHMNQSIVKDNTSLTDIIQYQMVKGIHMADEIHINENTLNAVQGSPIRFNYYYSANKYTAQGKEVFAADYTCSNGVIHFTMGPIIPPIGTIVDIVANDINLSTLLSLIEDAGFDTFLQDQDPITVFAPTNAAFAQFGTDRLEDLKKDTDLLTNFIKYHVIPGTLYAIGYHPSHLHTFEEKDKIYLHETLSKKFSVDNGAIDKMELGATNGVVHKIDTVLIPKSLTTELLNN